MSKLSGNQKAATEPSKPKSTFDLDLRFGKMREKALARILRWGKVEVKSDRMAYKTGNIFIEYKCRGQPSGMATTTAEDWALEYAPERWILIGTEDLRAIARQAWDEGLSVDGGDEKAARGVLIPLHWFITRPERRELL